MRFFDVVPQLSVADVRASQAWYRDVLGFRIDWIWHEDFGAVSRDEVRLYVTRDPGGPPCITCIDVDDADAFHAHCVAAGAEIESPLETKPWGMREFTVRDPDGHCHRIGHGVSAVRDTPGFEV